MSSLSLNEVGVRARWRDVASLDWLRARRYASYVLERLR